MMKNIGAPIKEVKTLIGSSYTEADLAISSMINKNKLPISADTGNSFRESLPTINLVIWGITRPTQLIPLVIATAEDVSRVAHVTVIVRNTKMFSPIDFASYSERDNKFIRQRIRISGTEPKAKNNRQKGMSRILTLLKLPISQYVILGS